MGRRSPRQTQGRSRASFSPPSSVAPWRSRRAIAIGLALALVAIGLAVSWSISSKEPANHLDQARKLLAAGLAGEAERALRAAIIVKADAPEPYRLLLEILRVEDRSLEADRLAWEAFDQVPPFDREAILRELTLIVLADLPDDLARKALTRWSTADPTDIEARVALLRRIAAMPQASDPDRPARLAELTELVANHPENLNAREALVSELADAGDPEQGRSILDAWPGLDDTRDARYWRLRGRWNLEYDHQPERAIQAFREVLNEQPHDWRTRYRLARALRQTGRVDESTTEGETVRRIREVLDPLTLTPRLEAALSHPDESSSRLELAEICNRAGLTRLAEAWKSL